MPKDIPPTGPNVADLREERMWGDEVECFRARLCVMEGIVRVVGDWGSSAVVVVISSRVLVFKLSWLGLRFIVGI